MRGAQKRLMTWKTVGKNISRRRASTKQVDMKE